MDGYECVVVYIEVWVDGCGGALWMGSLWLWIWWLWMVVGGWFALDW